MLQRVDAMESELAGLVESLRTGANRLTADLSLLEGGMGDLYDAAGRGEIPRRPRPRRRRRVPPSPCRRRPRPPSRGDGEDVSPTSRRSPRSSSSRRPGGRGGRAGRGRRRAPAESDTEGARLVALNMALNGTSREETDRYLAENFDLADRGGLLDEVYATVEP